MKRNLRGAFIALAIVGVGYAVLHGGDDSSTGSDYASLTVAQQARVDSACKAGTTFPTEHPAEFGHCVVTMSRQVSGG